MEKVIEKLSDYIAKCDVPNSQTKRCQGSNFTDGCVALVEHDTKGMNIPSPSHRPAQEGCGERWSNG